MATIEDLYLPYPDFKLQEIIDPEQFDINNEYTVIKMNEVLEVVNQIIGSIQDGASGSDLISLTPITGFVSTKLQSFLEEVITILQSSEGSTRVGTPALEGLPGLTVAEQLASIKAQLVGHAHDERYYTKQDTYARGEFDLLKFELATQSFVATEGQRVFTLTNGTYTVGKNRMEVVVGGVEQTVGVGSGFAVSETSSTSVTLSEGVPAGTKVVLNYYAGEIPIQLGIGHGTTHAQGSYDPIDITKLVNYDLVATAQQLADTAENFQSTTLSESGILGQEIINATGWVSTGWTGDFANGFTHTTGQTVPLTKDIGATGTNIYLVKFRVTSPTSNWHLTVTIGNSLPFEIYTGDAPVVDYSLSVRSISDGVLSFNPDTAFDGKITNISVKQVTGKRDATMVIKDSNDSNAFEVSNTLSILDNMFVGKNSGKTNVDGYGNVGLGANTLSENVTGFWNNAIGLGALQNNIAGSRNVAIGFNALLSNVSGQRNQAIGSWALPRNTTGIKNIGIGSDCLFYNTIGSQNIAVGFASLQSNVSGNDNIGIGARACNNVTTANQNIAIGFEAIQYNQTGANNIAIGYQALYGASGGNPTSSIAIGYRSAQRAGVGSGYNVTIGESSSAQNTTGVNNVTIGHRAGLGVTGQSTSNNVIIGYDAGRIITTGANDNVFIGWQTGLTTTTGANNILIGSNKNAPSATTSNWLNIGDTIKADMSGVNNNLFVGYQAGSTTTTGTGNIVIGSNKNLPTATTNSWLNIGGVINADMGVFKLGLGSVTSPQARLHLPPTTAGVPSMIIETGALNGNPISDKLGAIYYDGTDLYFNNHQGQRRKITMGV